MVAKELQEFANILGCKNVLLCGLVKVAKHTITETSLFTLSWPHYSC